MRFGSSFGLWPSVVASQPGGADAQRQSCDMIRRRAHVQNFRLVGCVSPLMTCSQEYIRHLNRPIFATGSGERIRSPYNGVGSTYPYPTYNRSKQNILRHDVVVREWNNRRVFWSSNTSIYAMSYILDSMSLTTAYTPYYF
ncbi:hypothetical protein GGS20DRAFT_528848 [Poronia punctata]|nr:hypothetical protein GGS20DRAFT_528848 [Poronia punctata]